MYVCVYRQLLVNGKSAGAISGFCCVWVWVRLCVLCINGLSAAAYPAGHWHRFYYYYCCCPCCCCCGCFCYCCCYYCCCCCGCRCAHVSMTAEDTFSVSCLIRLARRCIASAQAPEIQQSSVIHGTQTLATNKRLLILVYPVEKVRIGRNLWQI